MSLSYAAAATEVGKEKASHGFSFGMIAMAHPSPKASGSSKTHANIHHKHESSSHADMGGFLDWIHETANYLKGVQKLDDLMRSGKTRTQSYLDFSPFDFPAARHAANAPMLHPAMLRKLWLEEPAPK